MRKLITSNFVSLDGYIAAADGDLSWHNVNSEFFGYAESMLEAAGTLVFGRKTYEMMAAYWSADDVRRDDPVIANYMNSLDKIVFSSALTTADWENTKLFGGDVEKNIGELKLGDGGDIIILGSGTIVAALTQADLIDEHRIFINPVILGDGVLQYAGNFSRKILKLTDLKTFKTGVIMLTYQPIK